MKLINAADAYNSAPLRTGICEARNEASLNNPTPAFVREIRLLPETIYLGKKALKIAR